MAATSLKLPRSLLKSKDITKTHDQSFLHAMLLKVLFPFPEEFQYNISSEINIWRWCSSTVDINSTVASPFS